MEAVPRLPMLAFELKHSPEYVDFGPTLKKFIREHYGEDPAAYNKNFSDLDQLRQNAIHVTRDFVGCATLKKYYAQLHLINGRFPMGEGGEAAITFTWEDNQTGRDHIMADIKFEQACILYNIGALHSNLGAIDTRHNAEGMKVSCTHFQCAAWAFEHLRDHFGSSSMSTDMAHEYLTFHVNVMLAQAQECILEKSMIDSRKNTITAKVSAQVVEFYRSSVKNLDQCNTEQIINSRSYKDWKKRIELKIAFYQCITHYYMGKQAEEQQKWGERLAYFQAAQDKLNEAVKLAKNEVPEMQEALRFAQDVVGGKLQSAQKDNDFIYHEKIPPLDSLPEVKGAPLVKGIPFDPMDQEISGPDIFQKLVPMEAHEASSVYSEEKAKLLRAVMENIETSNVELEQFMTSLQIDPSLFEQLPDRLPQELLEKCAAMSVRTNAIKDLVDAMSAVSGLATEAEMNIKEIQDILAEDAQKTKDFEKQYGKKMPSSVLPGLAKDCESHAEKHSQGSQLNSTLHAAMNAHITNLRMLALPPDQLQAKLPSAQPTISQENEEMMTEMRRLLNKVEEMKVQRGTLEKQFRDDIQKDDITTVLMGADSTKDSIYQDQLKKHDTLIGYIGQNLNAQENILRALTDANARFATIRQAISQQSSQREGMIQDLILSFEKYEELLAKSKKGQEYYSRLNEAVTKTLERCRSECKVRQEERDMIASKYAPKEPPPSRPTAPKPGQPGTPSTPTPTSTTPFIPGMTPDPAQLPPGAALSGPPGAAPLPAFEGPKLKDFLPFMKPQSFGPKASSPSPQVLPPGSPDPMLSGPPSLASSASDSPQHRTLGAYHPSESPSDQQPEARPLGHRGPAFHPAVSGSTPDVAAAGQLPTSARISRPDIYQARVAPPPDVTANLPVNPSLQSQRGNLPDVSSLQSQNHSLPDESSLSMAKEGFSSLPPHLAAQLGPYGGAVSAAGRGMQGSDTVMSSSSSESLASTGSFQQGQIAPPRPPGSVVSAPAVPHSSQSTAGPSPAPAQHPPMQQYQPPPQIHSRIPGQPNGSVQYPVSYGVPSQQAMMRPSPSPSPVSSPAPSPAVPAYHQQTMHSQGGNSMPLHLAQAASMRPGTPPQKAQVPSGQQFQPPHQHQQQPHQHYQQPNQQQYFPGGAVQAQQSGGAQYNQGYSAAQQQPGVVAPPRPQSPVISQAGQHAPRSMQVYGQPGQSSVVRSLAPDHPQPSQMSARDSAATSVPGLSFGQQPYSLPSSSVPTPYSTIPAPSGQGLASTSQALSMGQSQTASGGAFSVSSGHPQTSQYQHQQPGQQQPIPGMMPHSQFPPSRTSQPQLPPTHSQLPASSQSTHPIPQQAFQQPPGYSHLNQNSSHIQGQVSAQVPGLGSGPVAGPGQGVGQYVAGAQNMGVVPGAVPPQAMSQQPQHPQPQTPGLPQTFQPHLQPQQHRPPVSSHYQAGYSQGSQNFIQSGTASVIPPSVASMAGQSHAAPSQVSQSPMMGGQVYPGQQGYPPGPRPQQFSQQQVPQQKQPNMFPQQSMPHPQGQPQIPQHLQQSFPRQQYHPQQHQQQYPQQHFSQQKQPMPQQHQQFPPQHPSQQQHPQEMMQPQSHQMQGQQIRPQGPQQPMPGQHPQSQQPYPKYPTQQAQPQIPPESQLIFPTPLQPSVVQPAGTAQPPTPTSQPGVSSQVPGAPHSLPLQGSDLQPSSSTPTVQPAHASLPPTPQTQPGSNIPAAPVATTSVQPGSMSGPSLSRQESSLDELLSSSPEGSKHTGIPAPIITPKVLTDQEKQQQKEEAMKKGAIVETVKDPYSNSSVLNKLVSDVEAFGKFVDDLSVSILGVSRLDTVWKSLIDSQDHDVKKQSIAIARCYPMKNRDPDIMPYDETRVVLSTTKDDYINASWINDLAPSCPKFVASQAPLTVTMTDFWAMVYELGSEVIVQITSEYETSKKFPVYFPTEKGQQMEQGPMIVTLQSVKYRQLWTERNIYLKHSQTKQGRTVIHLQFKTWPVSGFPEEVQHIVRFISEVHSFYQQQRSLLKPVIVHCGNGVGRTGAFLMIYTGMQEMLHGNGLIDVPALAKRMLQKRKNLIHKKEQLKFCYDALLCFAEDFLKKRNILVQHPHFEKKAKISEPVPTTASSDDIVLGSVNLHTLQQTVGRLHVHGDGEKSSAPASEHPAQPPQQPKDMQPLSSLPDLVQQQSRTEATLGQGGGGQGGGSASGIPFTPQGMGGSTDGRAELSRTHSRSGSNASLQSLPSLTESGSSRASPQHPAPSFSHSPSPSSSVGAGGVSQTLADLQDPTKFTIGKGEQKKRFSKASFEKKVSGSGLEVKQDPADPLSSLDAMWTIHKSDQSEK